MAKKENADEVKKVFALIFPTNSKPSNKILAMSANEIKSALTKAINNGRLKYHLFYTTNETRGRFVSFSRALDIFTAKHVLKQKFNRIFSNMKNYILKKVLQQFSLKNA